MGLFDKFKKTEESPEQQQEREFMKSLEQEFQVMRFFDAIYANPLLLLHSKKVRANYLKKTSDMLDTRPEAKNYWTGGGKDLLVITDRLLDQADDFAREKGETRHPRTKGLIYTLVLFGAVIGATMILNFIPELAGVGMYASWIGICIMCCISQYITKHFQGKFMKFQEGNAGEFSKLHEDEVELLHEAAQYFLEDIRQRLLAEGKDVSKFKLQLLNSDYNNIRVLDSGSRPGSISQVHVVQLLRDGEDPDDYDADDDVDHDITLDVDDDDIDDGVDYIDDIDDELDED